MHPGPAPHRGAGSTRRAAQRPGAALWGRVYFAVQALGGAAWWAAVALVPVVRDATLGPLDPVPTAVLDLPLFVGACARAVVGCGGRPGRLPRRPVPAPQDAVLHNIS